MIATSVKYHHTPHAIRTSSIYANIRFFVEKSFLKFLNIECELFDRLYHYFEATNTKPDHRDESRFKYSKKVKHNHCNTSESEEYCLADTRIHREDRDITPVVDFFDEKNDWSKEA